MTNAVREELLNIAGVVPSSHWLEDCQTALSSDEADAVMQQILHHDLRDVVRELGNDENSMSQAATALRQAQAQSLQEPNFKALLPDSFRLLVQVEEFIDVSVNAQLRLAHGPANPAEPTAVGNQRNRCLKLIFSDGYPTHASLLVAMEIAPVPSLSVQSLAGLKIILNGPLQLRHGLCMLHPGNTTVLGGQVPALVEIQHAALQQAKKVAGVGVDPTIKALIWNPDQPVDGEEEDEAEHASSDVPAAAAPVQAPPRVPVAPLQPPRNNEPPARTTGPAVTYPAASATTQPVQNPPRSAVSTLPPPPQQRQQQQQQPRVNPYSTSASATTASQVRSNTVPGVNPYSQRAARIPTTTQRPVSSLAVNNPTPSTTAVSAASAMPPTSQVTSLGGALQKPTAGTALSDNSTPSWTFDRLYEQLLQAQRGDSALYQSLFPQQFIVSAQQYGPKEYFNIDKRKKRQKGDDKKYHYVMGAKVYGGGDPSRLLSCRVDSSILEPYFGLAPSEMRQLNRTDKERATNLVREGGRQVQAQMQQLAKYQVALLFTPEEFASIDSLQDGKKPVILLQKRLG